MYRNPDLHSHSVFSDGALEPEAVADRAAAHGVDLWALTDHDSVQGQDRALAAARARGMDYLTGVEISVSYRETTVHVIGLGFDHADPRLIAGLDATRAGREQRARRMGERLEQLGISHAYEGALQYAEYPDSIARPHFARWLVERGVCRDVADAFNRYLGDGKPAWVPHAWTALDDALRWITAAGGAAVLAHPARYAFGKRQERQLFADFMQHGGSAVEVVSGCQSSPEAMHYAHVARSLGLAASRGSDFHGPGEHRVEPGSLPPLPGGLDPAWERLASRVLRAG